MTYEEMVLGATTEITLAIIEYVKTYTTVETSNGKAYVILETEINNLINYCNLPDIKRGIAKISLSKGGLTMPTFKLGSTHELKVRLKLPDDYEKDEEDIPVSFWLEDSEGNPYDIMGYVLDTGGVIPLTHLTKTFQEVVFETTMPKKEGEYKVKSNVSGSYVLNDMESARITIKDEPTNPVSKSY
jgi:hypothetical protein